MMKKDSLWLGLLAGLVLPALGYFIFFGILQGLDFLSNGIPISDQFRERTLFLVSVCFNLIAIQVFQIRRWPEAGRGVVLITGVFIVIWFFLYGRYLL